MENRTTILLALFVCVSAASAVGSSRLKDVNDLPNPVEGLSWTFYNESCPNLESIVKERIEFYLGENITDAAGLLRLHFHDCFVQGCDASVLIVGSGAEQEDAPNLTLRPKAFQIINDIKQTVEANCSGVVSCADIVALAARESVAQTGGPNYSVPLGRRDSLQFANTSVTDASLPGPTFNLTALTDIFSNNGLNLTDLVALSGAHTIGFAHCGSFINRLYDSEGNVSEDPTLNQTFAGDLYATCPTNSSSNATVLDIQTPNAFDNKYYVNLQNGEVLFTSDESLYTDNRTRDIVDSFALNQTLFFEKFVLGMFNMGQINVLTGSQGEIRSNCSVGNSSSLFYGEIIQPVVDSEESSSSSSSM